MRYHSPVPAGKNTGTTRPDGQAVQEDSCNLPTIGYGLRLLYTCMCHNKDKKAIFIEFFVHP